jgi:hypothetical protein
MILITILWHPVASDSQENTAPSVLVKVPSNFTYKKSQDKKYRHAEKELLKKNSELANIVQQQSLESKKLENHFLEFKKKLLQLSLAINQNQDSNPFYPWDKFVAKEVTGSIMMLQGISFCIFVI